MGRILLTLMLGVGALMASDYAAAKRKFEQIRKNEVPYGSRVVLKQDELNAFVRTEVQQVAPQGIREPRVELGNGRATVFARVDFAKLQRAQGKPLNWFMSRLLSGERPVRIDARIHSSGGTATVEVERVLVSGMALTGGMLEYLVRNVLWSYYPQAQAGKPFELSNRIERLEVQPSEVRVVIAEAPAGWRRLATPAVAVPPGR